jgi:hypothetical protein
VSPWGGNGTVSVWFGAAHPPAAGEGRHDHPVVQLQCSQLQRPEQDLGVIFHLERPFDLGVCIGMHPGAATAVQIREIPACTWCAGRLELMNAV